MIVTVCPTMDIYLGIQKHTYYNVIHESHDWLWLVADDGRIIYANPRNFTKMGKYPLRVELVNHRILETPYSKSHYPFIKLHLLYNGLISELDRYEHRRKSSIDREIRHHI